MRENLGAQGFGRLPAGFDEDVGVGGFLEGGEGNEDDFALGHLGTDITINTCSTHGATLVWLAIWVMVSTMP